jgi:hypothetical protein
MRLSDSSERSSAGSLFEEMVTALSEMPGVALGRRYCCWCIKLVRYPFIALDGDQIAFRVGLEASALLPQFPQARLWNPRNDRQAKQSWISLPAGKMEPIATLGAIAYMRATKGEVNRKIDVAAR